MEWEINGEKTILIRSKSRDINMPYLMHFQHVFFY